MVGGVAWMALQLLLANVRVVGRDWRVTNAVVFNGERIVAIAVKAVARRTISFSGVLALCCKIKGNLGFV